MATKNDVQKTYGIGYRWGTYDLAGVKTVAMLETHKDRTRKWDRPFKSRRAAMEQLLERGFLPTTRYTDDLQWVMNSKVVTVTGLLNWQSNSLYCYSFVPDYNRITVDLTSAAVGTLVSSVQAQLQSRISGNGTNLVVSAAEAKSTVGMIGDAVKRLATAYSHVRHRKFRAAATALGLKGVPARVGKFKTPDENWLEYRYGWRLVVYDLSSLMKTLYDCLRDRPPLLRVTAKAISEKETLSSQGRWQIGLPNGYVCGDVAVTRTLKESFDVRGGYVYELESAAIANQQSFGLANPFMWAWELIPYSFVLDWILNIGSILEGLTAFIGKRWKDGWICKAGMTSALFRWTNPVKGADVYTFKIPNPLSFGPWIERRFLREQMGFTPSQIRVSIDLGVPRVLDAISLVTTRFRH